MFQGTINLPSFPSHRLPQGILGTRETPEKVGQHLNTCILSQHTLVWKQED